MCSWVVVRHDSMRKCEIQNSVAMPKERDVVRHSNYWGKVAFLPCLVHSDVRRYLYSIDG
jgi:hypothetical protein